MFISTNDNEQELPESAFLLNFRILAQEQQKDQPLLNKVKAKGTKYTINTFHGGEMNRLLIFLDGKIVVKQSLQQRIVDWYHTMLCHPGETRTEETIGQYFSWKGLKPMVQRACKA